MASQCQEGKQLKDKLKVSVFDRAQNVPTLFHYGSRCFHAGPRLPRIGFGIALIAPKMVCNSSNIFSEMIDIHKKTI